MNGLGITWGMGVAAPGPHSLGFYRWNEDDEEGKIEKGWGLRLGRFYIFVGLIIEGVPS